MTKFEISNSSGFVNPLESLKYFISKVESFEGNNLLHLMVLDDSLSDNSEGKRRLYGVLQCLSSDSVNNLNDNGYSALHLAVLKERLWMVKILSSSRNIDVNLKSSYKKLSNTALHLAVKSGNVSIVNELLKRAVDVNARNLYNQTPLHIAVQSCSLETVELLVKKGAIENSEDYMINTPLHYAVKFGHEDIFKWLIDRNSYLNNSSREFFNTVIHDAAFSGNSVIVETLVEMSDINTLDTKGSTPLHLAVRSGDTKTIKCLVAKNADVNALNRNYETVLHSAARYCDLTTFKLLEKKSNLDNINNRFLLHQSARSGSVAKVAYVNENAGVNIRDRFGLTPLHHAILSNNYETVEYLVKANASVNAIAIDEDNKTVLQFAVESGKSRVIKLLLSKGAEINNEMNDFSWLCSAVRSGDLETVQVVLEHCPDVHVQDEDDKTPIYYAAQGNHVDIIQTLLDHDAHVNAVETSHNPLHVAALLNRTEAAQILLERGAEVDAKDDNDHTPLIHALAFGDLLHSGIVELLINRGANIFAECPDGNTALHYACQMHTFQLDILNLLFNSGSKVNATNARGRTPLHCAAITNNVGALRLLVEKGADPNPKDVDGDTPLHYASRRGHERFVTVLLKRGARVNAKGHRGRTPLHLAGIEGGDEVFDALLKMGADVNIVDDDEKTPYQYEESDEASSSAYSSEDN